MKEYIVELGNPCSDIYEFQFDNLDDATAFIDIIVNNGYRASIILKNYK